MMQAEYLIQELSDATGVSTRTIRYYQQEGLLPEPVNRGKFAYYTNDHLERLKLIQELKENFFPLKEIRDRLDSITSPQVQALLESLKTAKLKTPKNDESSQTKLVQPDSDTAVDYIARLLRTKSDLRSLEPRISPPKTQPQQYVSGSPSESWRRIYLASGIEIQIKEPLSPQDQKNLEELIKYARKLFL